MSDHQNALWITATRIGYRVTKDRSGFLLTMEFKNARQLKFSSGDLPHQNCLSSFKTLFGC